MSEIYQKGQIRLASKTLATSLKRILNAAEYGKVRLVTSEKDGEAGGGLINTPLTPAELLEITDEMITNDAIALALKRIINEYGEGKTVVRTYEDSEGNAYEVEVHVDLQNPAFKYYFKSALSRSLVDLKSIKAGEMLNAAGFSSAISAALRPPDNRNLKEMPKR